MSSKKGEVTYVEMAHEAILEIGDKTGSSLQAMTKVMMQNHEHLKLVHPKHFRNSLNLGLKVSLLWLSYDDYENTIVRNAVYAWPFTVYLHEPN